MNALGWLWLIGGFPVGIIAARYLAADEIRHPDPEDPHTPFSVGVAFFMAWFLAPLVVIAAVGAAVAWSAGRLIWPTRSTDS